MPYFTPSHHALSHVRGKDPDAAGSETGEELRIFYQLYGHGEIKVLLIAGLACSLDVWRPQLVDLCGTDVPNESLESNNCNDEGVGCETSVGCSMDLGVQVCAFDNRGVGRSSIPSRKSDYTTTIMAGDAKALLGHLGWKKVHICGHSMGGMIACKLVTQVPDSVASLALLSVTGGGYECLPKMNYTSLSIIYRFLRAKSNHERVLVDLDTHYTKDYLDTIVNEVERRVLLFEEYMNNMGTGGSQSEHGFHGHAHACWVHHMSKTEINCIRSLGFPIAVIHGKGDVIAQIKYGRKLAARLSPSSRMVELPGGHLVTHQNSFEVNQALLKLIQAGNHHIHQEPVNPFVDNESREHSRFAVCHLGVLNQTIREWSPWKYSISISRWLWGHMFQQSYNKHVDLMTS